MYVLKICIKICNKALGYHEKVYNMFPISDYRATDVVNFLIIKMIQRL